ncbi:MAG: CBS domain-containing protein [Thaumarchaeota archaeon]|nr:CBS domain-containing protein [Nitrososphaerota archaeon]
MKIEQAFPHILEKQVPVVKSNYPLLTVLYLLRMQDVDAVPIVPVTNKGARAVFGFSSLPHFMNLGPEGFAELLRGPCEAASDELNLLSVEDELGSLLDAFKSRTLGLALVHEGGRKMKAGLLSLTDVLALYGTGVIHAGMTVGDVGSPILSLPSTTTIREALQAMFRHRHRRVFLTGVEAYVSDRSIMSSLFSPTILEQLGSEKSKDILSTPIAKVEKVTPVAVGPKTSLSKAAYMLRRDRGGCLITSEKKVVTPWDVVMKPWLTDRLTIA